MKENDLSVVDVCEKGQRLFKFSSYGIVVGICGIGLAILIGFISVGTGADFISPFIFYIAPEYSIAYFFVLIDYFLLLWGIISPPLYLFSILTISLGNIWLKTNEICRNLKK